VRLGIHDTKESFCQRWIAYCDEIGIEYKIVNCYSNQIIDDLQDCDALLWHHQQGNPRDIVFAKQLLFALQQSGKPVFPDFNTGWHFDDKVGQKYLIEALGIREFVPTWVYYNKSDAMTWAMNATFPKVFKLRIGAGSQNVKLIRSVHEAKRMIHRAFGVGLSPYDAWGSLKERYRKFRMGKAEWKEVVKGIIRMALAPPYAQVMGREKGYVYFQEFMPNNQFDIRIIVIDGKAFALKRFVRKNDFRASGSGSFKYEREEFDERCVSQSFDYTARLGAQCVAYDYVFDKYNDPRLIEINYGFSPPGYDNCTGYWDTELVWHPGSFNPYGWMVELVIKQIQGLNLR